MVLQDISVINRVLFLPLSFPKKQHLFFSGPQLRGPRKCKRGGTDGKIDRFFFKRHVMSVVLIYHHMMVFFLQYVVSFTSS